jgi:DNA-binding NtrC family response regulator
VSLGKRGSETILLVEDEVQVRAVARGILRRAGYQVLEAATAGDAIVLCEQHTGVIDLLLTDIVLPLMNGRVLAERLRAAQPRMKVLLMSGYSDETVVHNGVTEQGFAFLQKPFTPHVLTLKVREVLGPNWSAAAAGSGTGGA